LFLFPLAGLIPLEINKKQSYKKDITDLYFSKYGRRAPAYSISSKLPLFTAISSTKTINEKTDIL
jgi:hypothetical protein